MRYVLGLISVTLLLAASAAAQGPVGVGATSGIGSNNYSGSRSMPWQVSFGYQYNRINLIGKPFNTNGFDADVDRYFGRWFGVEAQFGTGFGNTGTTTSPSNLNTKSFFAGAGPRLAYRNGNRIEPWLHMVIGMEHFRFTQTVDVLGTNTALAGAAGGGLDIHMTHHQSFRVEADAIGSRFFSTNQRHFQAVAGWVIDF